MDYVILGLLGLNIVIMILLLIRSKSSDGSYDRILRDEMQRNREETKTGEKVLREELMNAFSRQSTLIENSLDRFNLSLNDMIKDNRQQTEENRNMIDSKLEKMRETVEEKLQTTLQKRIGEAFTRVEQQLERVQKDLGKMQALADGVGDLKRVLTNVKERGTWGEVKLGSILEQILTPEQFAENVQVKSQSQERVDYAVKLPGSGDDVLWLPIDAKFPQESYLRILQVSKDGDKTDVDKAVAELIKAVQKSAADIRDKYINPPKTTDFAIMFLPTEGLYSEVLRVPGVMESIQEKYRVVIAGPTTLSAIMNSLRMGFKTLAIEKKASEVWKYLSAVKTQFRLFGEVMEKLKDQVSKVSRTLDKTSDRARIMDSRLRSLEQISDNEADDILGIDNPIDE
ncbi:MAG: DNA recombination protein RmuC [Candidatus Stygibacter australis]|nr:DNA recombination protein RmuC [Candidatus Stygibacter australis]MDP8322453.1 DNA recombination protein RmuC [Candidatus Stygibacter australis]